MTTTSPARTGTPTGADATAPSDGSGPTTGVRLRGDPGGLDVEQRLEHRGVVRVRVTPVGSGAEQPGVGHARPPSVVVGSSVAGWCRAGAPGRPGPAHGTVTPGGSGR